MFAVQGASALRRNHLSPPGRPSVQSSPCAESNSVRANRVAPCGPRMVFGRHFHPSQRVSTFCIESFYRVRTECMDRQFGDARTHRNGDINRRSRHFPSIRCRITACDRPIRHSNRASLSARAAQHDLDNSFLLLRQIKPGQHDIELQRVDALPEWIPVLRFVFCTTDLQGKHQPTIREYLDTCWREIAKWNPLDSFPCLSGPIHGLAKHMT